MSTTLTWFNSGLGAKTGTTSATLVDDLVTLINSKSGDANFSWAVASSNNGSSPRYVVLKPKSGAVGRILMVVWTSLPANNNAAILSGNPTTDALYVTYFPAGNVDSPSNLTAASGTILGDDTGVMYVSTPTAISTVYGASIQPYYFDSADAVMFGFQNPASATNYIFGAGMILVDQSDVAYAGNFALGNQGQNTFIGSAPMGWTSGALSPSSTVGRVRTNYGSANRMYFQAFTYGGWQGSTTAADDMLVDAATSKADFVPFTLVGQTKVEGFALKFRQFGFGPHHSNVAFPIYSTSGPVVAARKFNGATGGGGGLWFTNFKI